MLYIGHFSFDEIGSDHKPRHGYFTCVVDTDNAETATNEFKELIISLRGMDDIFKNITTVYMEDIIEIYHIPRKAIVTRIQSSEGQFPKSISRSLPNAVSPGIKVYGWAPDVKASEAAEENEKYRETLPFIEFRKESFQ